MRKIPSLLILCLFAAGCVSTSPQQASTGDLSTLEGKTIAMSKRSSPAFLALTPSKGMFAVAGVAIAASTGNELVKNTNISDPALAIAEGVTEITPEFLDRIRDKRRQEKGK